MYFYYIFETLMSIFINAAHHWPRILTNNKAKVWQEWHEEWKNTSSVLYDGHLEIYQIDKSDGKIALLFVFFYPIL